jgi:hypothetical protein
MNSGEGDIVTLGAGRAVRLRARWWLKSRATGGGALTVLDGVPEGCGVLFGEAHDLFCVAIADEIGLLAR